MENLNLSKVSTKYFPFRINQLWKNFKIAARLPATQMDIPITNEGSLSAFCVKQEQLSSGMSITMKLLPISSLIIKYFSRNNIYRK